MNNIYSDGAVEGFTETHSGLYEVYDLIIFDLSKIYHF